MPTEEIRLQTKWDIAEQRWKVYLSMDKDSQRTAQDIVDNSEGQDKILDLKDKDKIQTFLGQNKGFRRIRDFEDRNSKVILEGKKQESKPGLHLALTLNLLSAALLVPLASNVPDFVYKQWMVANEKTALSPVESRNQSAITTFLIVAIGIINIIVTASAYKQSRQFTDDENAYKKTQGLINRLPAIKDEVKLKDKTLNEIENFLKSQDPNFRLTNSYQIKKIDRKGKNHTVESNYRNEIIQALDHEDNIEYWKILAINDQNMEAIYSNTLDKLKTIFIPEYEYFLTGHSLLERVQAASTLNALFDSAIDLFNRTNIDDYENLSFPTNFIFSQFVLAIQNQEKNMFKDIVENRSYSYEDKHASIAQGFEPGSSSSRRSDENNNGKDGSDFGPTL